MATVQIEELFDEDRFPDGINQLAFLVYFPFGILLFAMRFFIGFQVFLVSCLLPKMTKIRSVVLRWMCGILGVSVRIEGEEHRDPKVKVMVANYTSTLDHMAVDLVLPNILPCVWDLPPTLIWLLGYTDMGARQGRETLISNAKKHSKESKVPMLVFPEGASTNGKVGLLKFSVWPFSLEQPVQPLLITLSRPSLAKVKPSVLGGRWWIDMFWFLFVPYTSFCVKVLPVIEQQAEESCENLTVRVQKTMAVALNLQPTSHTSADKVEYAKKKLFVQSTVASASPSSSLHTDIAIELMARQVKEVLPHVPTDVVRKDLSSTRDVDQTISRLLEGQVHFTPIGDATGPGLQVPLSNTVQNKQAVPPTSAAAKSVSGNTPSRLLTFQERKSALIADARLKYMKKHGIVL